MKKFNWEAFAGKDNKIAVWCKTEDEAKDFCKLSHEYGLDWGSGNSRLEKIKWNYYESMTCYIAHEYCRKQFYIDEGYTILEWSDYMLTAIPETEIHMTDEEIFEMLRPKIEKNGIKTDIFSWIDYIEKMRKAVAIAYRSGYGRGQKGRPFKMNTNNQNPDSYSMGYKVTDKKPEIGDRVVMAEEHTCKQEIGTYWPHVGVCGKVAEYGSNGNNNIRIAWDSGVEESDFGGWWIEPKYLKVIE